MKVLLLLLLVNRFMDLWNITCISFRPRGKESTEVRITQNKGKESENSYQKLERSRWTGTRTHTRKQNQNILTDTAVFLNQKRATVCEHTKKMVSLESDVLNQTDKSRLKFFS